MRAAHTNDLLEVDRLSVRFGATQVLKDLTFTVARGSSLAIIGPNGAGKSVLQRALLGSIPSEGVIRWAPDAGIGYVPQKLDLDRLDLLRGRLALAGESQLNLAHVFDVVGISEATAERLIGTYSGGQFQRLLIAFALLGKPNVLTSQGRSNSICSSSAFSATIR